MENTKKDCFNCKHYIVFADGEVEICLIYKIRIYAESGIRCVKWEHEKNDDLHANDAMERMQQENAADLLHKE